MRPLTIILRSVLDRFRSTENLLARIRLLFVALLCFSIVSALPRVVGAKAPAWPLNALVLGTAVALAAWAVSYARVTRARWVADVVPLALLLVQGLVYDDVAYTEGALYAVLFLQALYPMTRTRRITLGLGYVVVLVTLGQGAGRSTVEIMTTLVTFLVMGLLIQAIFTSVTRHDRLRATEEVLTNVTAGLLSARDPQEVADRVVQGALCLVGSHGLASLWRQEDDAFVRVALVGREAYPVSRIPLAAVAPAMLDAYHAGQVIWLDTDEIAAMESLVGEVQGLRAAAAVPLVRNGVVNGAVVVASDHPLGPHLGRVLPRFAHEVSLAMELADQHALLTGIVENSADVFLVVDDLGRVRYASPALQLLGGPCPDDVLGTPVATLFAPVDGDGPAPALLGTVPQALLLTTDVGSLEVEVASRPMQGGGTILNVRDVSERRRLEAEVSYRAYYDPVTDLANRVLFTDRLSATLRAVAGRAPRVAALMIDLDDFKRVNDSYGHATGDAVLVTVAQRIVAATRDTDTAARLGGDEFAVLMPDVGEAEALEVADRLLAALEAPVVVGEHHLSISMSIGVAVASGGSHEEILRDADAAMYRAKAAGKRQRAMFAPHMHAEMEERQWLQGQLEAALGTPQLRVAYQPIMALDHDAAPVGFEALLRWDHPERGAIWPVDFIPLAEQTGQILPLGRWVLHEACRQLGAWTQADATGVPLHLSVNLSSVQLRSHDIVADVASAIADAGIEPSQLVLEVTETALMDDVEGVAEVLRALRTLGVRIAIDDFGTGYSSFVHLQHFPVDVLKVDRSFVAAITDTVGTVPLAEAIIRLAVGLGVDTVAEGVESRDQASRLQGWGCVHGQGWLWAPAMSPDQAGRFLARHRATPLTATSPTPTQ